MASKLEKAREIINEVDTQMAGLFVKRMRAAELVYEHKKEYGLPILDQKREDAVRTPSGAICRKERNPLKWKKIFLMKLLMIQKIY